MRKRCSKKTCDCGCAGRQRNPGAPTLHVTRDAFPGIGRVNVNLTVFDDRGRVMLEVREGDNRDGNIRFLSVDNQRESAVMLDGLLARAGSIEWRSMMVETLSYKGSSGVVRVWHDRGSGTRKIAAMVRRHGAWIDFLFDLYTQGYGARELPDELR